MKALERQLTKPITTKEKGSIQNWDEWTRWLQERQEAIDNARTPEEKRAVVAKYQRTYQGRI
jgi:hypothetical protein